MAAHPRIRIGGTLQEEAPMPAVRIHGLELGPQELAIGLIYLCAGEYEALTFEKRGNLHFSCPGLPEETAGIDDQASRRSLHVLDGEGDDIDQDGTQLLISDAGGLPVFGPAGEGISPKSGIGSTEILELEAHPTCLVSPYDASTTTEPDCGLDSWM